MGSLGIVARDKDGKIKQDLHISRDKIKGKTVEVDKLKLEEAKALKEVAK